MGGRRKLLILVAIFLVAYLIPFESDRVRGAISEALLMLQEYAREHVLFCLVPAFFIAGAISAFLRSEAVIRYLGPGASRPLAYGVASVSGAVLAVCSCTVLPLFAGIYTRGAGIGPATAFLYSGPAINVLAVILTARVLGWKIGLARAVGAVLFSIVIGLMMSLIFRGSESKRLSGIETAATERKGDRPGWATLIYFLNLILILVFAAWGKPKEPVGFWNAVYRVHWYVAGALTLTLLLELRLWFRSEELREWVSSTRFFAEQILPLLFAGVLIAGFLMGRPGSEGLIPSRYISRAVGGNSILSNLIASLVGALMYFATLTEIPILQGLLGSGMGYGPALALLLAGPALSLPNMLAIRSIMGTKRTLVFIGLVVIMAALTGKIFGIIMGGG